MWSTGDRLLTNRNDELGPSNSSWRLTRSHWALSKRQLHLNSEQVSPFLWDKRSRQNDFSEFWTKSSSPTNRSPRALSVPWTCWNWEPICSKKLTRAPCTCWETLAFNWSSETGGYLFLDASFDPSFWDESFGPSFPEPFISPLICNGKLFVFWMVAVVITKRTVYLKTPWSLASFWFLYRCHLTKIFDDNDRINNKIKMNKCNFLHLSIEKPTSLNESTRSVQDCFGAKYCDGKSIDVSKEGVCVSGVTTLRLFLKLANNDRKLRRLNLAIICEEIRW